MNIKLFNGKYKVIVVFVLTALLACLIFSAASNTASKNIEKQQTVFTYQAEKKNSTVFDALLDYGKRNNKEILYNNNYKFGVLITSIGGIKSGDNGKYWQYYVNNKLGEVAANKRNITKNDIVEWRFEEVPF